MTKEKLKQHSFFMKSELKKLTLLKNQGICNTIYKLQTSKQNYLIREFKQTSHTLFNREKEFLIHQKVYEKNIGAKAHILQKDEFMVCDYLKGKHKTHLNIKELKILAKALKKLHSIKIDENPYDLKKDFISYKKQLKDKSSITLIKESLDTLHELKAFAYEPVLCHHDLNQFNVLFHKDKVRFIDWEFACINDRFFDLASLCIEFKLNYTQEKILLRSYFPRYKSTHYKKLLHYKILYTNLWKLWFKCLKSQ